MTSTIIFVIAFLLKILFTKNFKNIYKVLILQRIQNTRKSKCKEAISMLLTLFPLQTMLGVTFRGTFTFVDEDHTPES